MAHYRHQKKIQLYGARFSIRVAVNKTHPETEEPLGHIDQEKRDKPNTVPDKGNTEIPYDLRVAQTKHDNVYTSFEKSSITGLIASIRSFAFISIETVCNPALKFTMSFSDIDLSK